MKFAGIVGSLRKGSYNGALMRAAIELAPAGTEIELLDWRAVPIYDDDVYQQGFPAVVAGLRAAIAAADGVVIATPEYNYSVPGPLKNLLDWISRPPNQPFANKPVMIMGASPGGFGSVRSQLHLRQVLHGLNARVLGRPEVIVAQAATKIDAAGRLNDERTRQFIAEELTAFAAFAGR